MSNISHIICKDCPNIEICIECFANGTEGAQHLKTHQYQVFQALNFPLLEENWTAYQELKFLEAMEIHGFGNWNDISIKMGDKTAIEAERHFNQCYLPFLGQSGSIQEFSQRCEAIKKEGD